MTAARCATPCTTSCPCCCIGPPAIKRPRGDWSLDDWLDWQQQLHPRAIDLGLDRVRAVWQRLALAPGPARVVTVAGTNGKGSCAAAVEALALAGGRAVGCYTSPHLWRYNERVRLQGRPVADAQLLAAFRQVESARGDTSLSYFEYGTLAALCLFAAAELDLWVLEVGLGGRLDAVNLIDADVAVVTSVGLDHAAWLGQELEQIADEKLAIARPGRPLLLGEGLPAGAVARAGARGARITALGRDIDYSVSGGRLHCPSLASAGDLPVPAGLVPANLLLAVLALEALGILPPPATTAEALGALRVPGRCERRRHGDLDLILDVAHNREAAAHLAEYLRSLPPSRHTTMIFAALADKPIEDMSAELEQLADTWLLVPLDDARALDPQVLAERVAGDRPRHCCAGMDQALARAARDGGRAVVWGSFLTVAEAGHG